jgi:large subunit ribosomal protein L5
MAKAKEKPAKKKGGEVAETQPDGAIALPPSRKEAFYKETVAPALMERFKYSSPMAAPKLEKIVINMGVGRGEDDPKLLENAVRDLTLISGQRPVLTRAKASISNFKIRQGHKIGCKVTLRGRRMYHFFDKLVSIVLPRLRDFRGLSPKSFDGRGNFAIGLKEQIVFPEISYETFDRIRGMDVIVCTTARTDEEGRELLKRMGMPVRDN